jgi:hypothetical protein
MSKAGYLVPPLQGSGGARIGKVTHRSPRWAFFGDAPMALRELQNLCCVMRCVQSWAARPARCAGEPSPYGISLAEGGGNHRRDAENAEKGVVIGDLWVLIFEGRSQEWRRYCFRSLKSESE